MPARSVCLVTLSLSEAEPGRFGRQGSVTDIYHTIPCHVPCHTIPWPLKTCSHVLPSAVGWIKFRPSCAVFSHGPMCNVGFLGRWGMYACPQCLPSDTVPIRSWTRTLRPPGIRHRHLPYHTIPYHTGCATVDATSGYAWL